MKAIDTPNDTSGSAHALSAKGIEAVGLYLRQDRASVAMVEGLHSVGIKLFSVWEKGFPLKSGYFTEHQATLDAEAAVHFAMRIHQPLESQIFWACDFDATQKDIEQHILHYAKKFQAVVKQAGFWASVYGSGDVCSFFTRKGFAHAGWLAQSRGWSGYEKFKPHAAIIQGPETTLCGFDVDLDTIIDPSVLWSPEGLS